MQQRKRERWTEDEVIALPSGEHDYFDRKAAGTLADRAALGKALSALANSGGGHLIIGVSDDGGIEGVDPFKGGTRTREWLEQVAGATVQPELTDFRVHEVEPAAPRSLIPSGKVVLVVDVADSPTAPHQEVTRKIYFYRQAGHSVAAPHFYLEAVRNRIVGPLLTGSLKRLAVRRMYPHDSGLFVECRLVIKVTNSGNTAAYRWTVLVEGLEGPGADTGDVVLDWSRFPKPPRALGGISLDDTILPSLARDFDRHVIGFTIRPEGDANRFATEVHRVLPPGLALTYRVVSEFSAGEVVRTRFQDLDLTSVIAELQGCPLSD